MTYIDNTMPDCWEYFLVDLDTKEEIKFAISADDETGEYEVLQSDEDGNIFRNEFGDPVIIKKKGNIKLIKSKLKEE